MTVNTISSDTSSPFVGIPVSMVRSAFPQCIDTSRLALAVRGLECNELCIVATDGQIFRDKSEFLGSRAEPLITFERKSSGPEYSIYLGLPSLHGTYVGANDTPLETGIILKGGDSFRMRSTPIQIPKGRVANRAPRSETSIGEVVGRSIVALTEGESIVLGRLTFHDLPGVVSRRHATVRRLKNVSGCRRFHLLDGTRSDQEVFFERPGGEREQLHGRALLPPGTTLYFDRPGQAFTLPEPVSASRAFDSESTYESISRGTESVQVQARLLNLDSYTVAYEGTIFMRNPALDSSEGMRVTPAAAALIGIHIREGLKLIRAEKYDQAKEHFSKYQVLEIAGYRFQENNVFGLNEISGEAILGALASVASRSWFMVSEKLVYPSWGFVQPGVEAQTPREHALLKDFMRELTLIYAEEWTHAYQHALGRNVSKKGELIHGAYDYEVDVAQFFVEQRVPLSYTFLKDRYPERWEVIQRLKGVQDAAEIEAVMQQISLLTIGQNLLLGREPSALAKNIPGTDNITYTISPQSPSPHSFQFDSMERASIERLHAIVTQKSDGNFLLSPYQRSDGFLTEVFAPDAYGIWRIITEPVTLEPGTPFRLGKYFQLSLPNGY